MRLGKSAFWSVDQEIRGRLSFPIFSIVFLPILVVHKWHLKWSRDGSYRNLFESGIQQLLLANKLDLSVLHGDGSNTTAKKGVPELATRDTSIRKG